LCQWRHILYTLLDMNVAWFHSPLLLLLEMPI